ncbi:MAG: hypothetical protein HY555_05330 [Euryarchaeota archaeon]|nr:hypothetical protein [Euryarchaeota archaeon]
MLKGLTVFILVFSMAAPAVTAQGLGGDFILPSSPLYGLDLFLERLELFLTTDPMDKARVSLGHAKERLQELEVLAESRPRAGDVLRAEEEYSREMREVRNAFEETRDEGPTERLQADVVLETELRGQMVFIGRLKASLGGSPAGEGLLEVAERMEDRVAALRGEILSAMEGDKAAARKAGKTDEAIREIVGRKEVETKVRLSLEEGIKREELERVAGPQGTPSGGVTGPKPGGVPEATPAPQKPNATVQGPRLVLTAPFAVSSERVHKGDTLSFTGTFRNAGDAPMSFTIKANARRRGPLTSEIPLEFYRGDEIFRVEPGKELTITREFAIPAYIPTGTYDIYGFVVEATYIWQTFTIELVP